MEQNIIFERNTAKGVATIRLNRPKVNAINKEMLEALEETCNELSQDQSMRAVVLTGGGKHFAAGADIGGFMGLDGAGATAMSKQFHRTALALETLPQISISAINGFVLGGGLELALATDFRYAAKDAMLGNPEILLGIFPGGGATQRLTRLTGVTIAKDLTYSGRTIGAEEAMRYGIVSEIFEPEDLQAEAVKRAEMYAAGPAALKFAKQAIQAGFNLSEEEALANEAELFGEVFSTEDCEIGVRSFLENGPGKAKFTGR